MNLHFTIKHYNELTKEERYRILQLRNEAELGTPYMEDGILHIKMLDLLQIH